MRSLLFSYLLQGHSSSRGSKGRRKRRGGEEGRKGDEEDEKEMEDDEREVEEYGRKRNKTSFFC